MQVFESSYPATFGFSGTGIESQGGVLAGVVQLGLTSRGNVGKLKPKQFIGDEHILGMQPATKERLLKLADEGTLNAVVQVHGIAQHWQELTDALGRALATNWRRAAAVLGSGEALETALPESFTARPVSRGNLPQAEQGELALKRQGATPSGDRIAIGFISSVRAISLPLRWREV